MGQRTLATMGALTICQVESLEMAISLQSSLHHYPMNLTTTILTINTFILPLNTKTTVTALVTVTHIHTKYHTVHNTAPGHNVRKSKIPAASPCVAVVLKQAIQLKLCHAGSDGTHHLLVGKTADLVGIANHSYLKLCLDHTTDGGRGGMWVVVETKSRPPSSPHTVLMPINWQPQNYSTVPPPI